MVSVMPYGLLQKEIAKMAAPGMNRTMKSAFMDAPGDDFIARAVDAFKTAPTPECMMLFEHVGGAANRIDSACDCFSASAD